MPTSPIQWDQFDFAPVIHVPQELQPVDLTNGYDPQYLRSIGWGIGGYNEHRPQMYLADHFEGQRNIHMGVDIWTPARTPFYAFWDGEIAYLANNDRQGDYGPTIITKHDLGHELLFALHGHLSVDSLKDKSVGQSFGRGEQLGWIGNEEENGGWVPHLHFQLSLQDPGEADMPGVVAPEDRAEALQIYPDPAPILEPIH
ncbi:MAG: peptidoglycan DD-metalloendopeptidase family protein [Bacteroidota bacterium]